MAEVIVFDTLAKELTVGMVSSGVCDVKRSLCLSLVYRARGWLGH